MVKRILKLSVTAVFLGVQLVLSSCGKDELTEPATVTCQFETLSATAMSGQLVIERMDLSLSKIDISGRRVSESDMFFTRRFTVENGRFEVLGDENSSAVLQIPQGSYQTLVFYLTLREEEYEFEYGSSGETDETGDLAEYLENAKPGLLLVARYTNGGESFPVIVALNDDIRRVAAEATQDGMPSVVLQKEVPSLATVTLDPEYLFLSITSSMLESAFTFPLGGEEAVVISEEYNETIYNQLAGRMQGAVALTVEEQ